MFEFPPCCVYRYAYYLVSVLLRIDNTFKEFMNLDNGILHFFFIPQSILFLDKLFTVSFSLFTDFSLFITVAACFHLLLFTSTDFFFVLYICSMPTSMVRAREKALFWKCWDLGGSVARSGYFTPTWLFSCPSWREKMTVAGWQFCGCFTKWANSLIFREFFEFKLKIFEICLLFNVGQKKTENFSPGRELTMLRL